MEAESSKPPLTMSGLQASLSSNSKLWTYVAEPVAASTVNIEIDVAEDTQPSSFTGQHDEGTGQESAPCTQSWRESPEELSACKTLSSAFELQVEIKKEKPWASLENDTERNKNWESTEGVNSSENELHFGRPTGADPGFLSRGEDAVSQGGNQPVFPVACVANTSLLSTSASSQEGEHFCPVYFVAGKSSDADDPSDSEALSERGTRQKLGSAKTKASVTQRTKRDRTRLSSKSMTVPEQKTSGKTKSAEQMSEKAKHSSVPLRRQKTSETNRASNRMPLHKQKRGDKTEYVREDNLSLRKRQGQANRKASALLAQVDKLKGKLKKKRSRQCEVCGDTFNTLSLLMKHMQSHRSKSLLLCSECGQTFHVASALTRHLEGHKTYICKVCQASFGSYTKLTAHMKSHSDQQRYQAGASAEECENKEKDFPSRKTKRAKGQPKLFVGLDKKRKLQPISIATKLKILADVDSGTMKKVMVAQKYGLAFSTFSSILSQRGRLQQASFGPARKRMRRGAKGIALDDALFSWFQQTRAKGIPVSNLMMLSHAEAIATELGITGFVPSQGWLNRYKTRKNIVLRAIVSVTPPASDEAVEEWKSCTIPQLLQDYAPCDIYACSETSLLYQRLPTHVQGLEEEACEKGEKPEEPRLTVLMGANMDSTKKLPLLVLGKKPKSRFQTGSTQLPVPYKHDRLALMTAKIFSEWVIEFDRLLSQKNRKVALVVDSSHVHPCVEELQSVKLVFLPAGSTRALRPLLQGTEQAFKNRYRLYLVQRLLEHVMLGNGSYGTGNFQHANFLDTLCFVRDAWQSVKKETIESSFKKAGFHSPNPETNETSEMNKGYETDVQVCLGVAFNQLREVGFAPDVPFDVYLRIDDRLRTAAVVSVPSLVVCPSSNSHNDKDVEDDSTSVGKAGVTDLASTNPKDGETEDVPTSEDATSISPDCGTEMKDGQYISMQDHRGSVTRSKQAISIETKLKIIAEVDSGTLKKGMVAKKYGLAFSTLSSILAQRERLEKARFGPSRKKMRGAAIGTDKGNLLDEGLLSWFHETKAAGSPVSGRLISLQAQKIASDLGISGFVPSPGWLRRFKQRKNILLRGDKGGEKGGDKGGGKGGDKPSVRKKARKGLAADAPLDQRLNSSRTNASKRDQSYADPLSTNQDDCDMEDDSTSLYEPALSEPVTGLASTRQHSQFERQSDSLFLPGPAAMSSSSARNADFNNQDAFAALCVPPSKEMVPSSYMSAYHRGHVVEDYSTALSVQTAKEAVRSADCIQYERDRRYGFTPQHVPTLEEAKRAAQTLKLFYESRGGDFHMMNVVFSLQNSLESQFQN